MSSSKKIFYFLLFTILTFPARGAIASSNIIFDGVSGTIYKPPSRPLAAIVLVAGSGPIDRDGNTPFARNNSLRYLAQDLSKTSVVLAYDKRGVSGSKSLVHNESDVVFSDFVSDAASAVHNMIDAYPGIDLFVIGHSEGGLIALDLATKLGHAISGVVLIAPPPVPFDQLLIEQLRSNGSPSSLINQAIQLNEAIKNDDPLKEVPPELSPIFRPSLKRYLQSLYTLNPTEMMKRIAIPSLTIAGDRDLQVNLNSLQELTQSNSKATFIKIGYMNHVLKKVGDDYLQNIETYTTDQPNHPNLVIEVQKFIGRVIDGKRR